MWIRSSCSSTDSADVGPHPFHLNSSDLDNKYKADHELDEYAVIKINEIERIQLTECTWSYSHVQSDAVGELAEAPFVDSEYFNRSL